MRLAIPVLLAISASRAGLELATLEASELRVGVPLVGTWDWFVHQVGLGQPV
jgi:hypothetical protein